MIPLHLRRTFLRLLPKIWPNCNRRSPTMLGATFCFSVKAVTDSLDERKMKTMETMSDKSLILNASCVTATSVNQLLVISAAILVHHHENYRKTIENILLLMERILLYINSEFHQEELWSEMVVARAKLNDSKKALIDMQSLLEYVEKLVTATVDVTYVAGSEFSSTSLCEAFTSVQQKMQLELNKTKLLEAEYQAQEKNLAEIMGKIEKLPKSEESS